MNLINSEPPHQATNFNIAYFQESVHFPGAMEDLKNLKHQLYSAAEYLEVSYHHNTKPETQTIDTSKDCIINAFVNTMDHLSNVTDKMNDLLKHQIEKVSRTELRLSSIEQRLHMFHNLVDQDGRAKHSLVVDKPKHLKRYIIPAAETMNGPYRTKSKYQGYTQDDVNNEHQYKKAILAQVQGTPQPTVAREALPPLPRVRVAPSGNQNNIGIDIRGPSQSRFMKPSVPSRIDRSMTPNIHAITQNRKRPTTPTRPASAPTTPARATRQQVLQYISELQKLESGFTQINQGNKRKDEEPRCNIKALLNKHRLKKDDH